MTYAEKIAEAFDHHLLKHAMRNLVAPPQTITAPSNLPVTPQHVCPHCGRCPHCGQPQPTPVSPFFTSVISTHSLTNS